MDIQNEQAMENPAAVGTLSPKGFPYQTGSSPTLHNLLMNSFTTDLEQVPDCRQLSLRLIICSTLGSLGCAAATHKAEIIALACFMPSVPVSVPAF